MFALLGTHNGAQVYGLLHGLYKLAAAIYITRVVHLTNPNEYVLSPNGFGKRCGHREKNHVARGHIGGGYLMALHIAIGNLAAHVRKRRAAPLVHVEAHNVVGTHASVFGNVACTLQLFAMTLTIVKRQCHNIIALVLGNVKRHTRIQSAR